MCGIAGFFSFSNKFNQNHLNLLTSKLSHRGPDAEGLFFDGRAGLGHRRLSILDLSESAKQPMMSSDGRFIIVFNGEIYNYQELKKEWNIHCRTTSDTEVLLEAFSKFGINIVQRLNGMFAFVIYDIQRQEMFAVRDRIGIKPFYFYQSNKDFVFSSETKAIQSLDLNLSLDLNSLKDYFFLEYVPGAQSIFKQIKKLEPGHYIKITQEEFSIHKYYDLLSKVQPIYNRRENDYLDEFESLLSQSIKYQTISDVPIGAFLSGGTDSSIICSIFQKQNSSSINTFTMGFKVKEFDERYYASQVASILNTSHHEELIDIEEGKFALNQIVKSYDEPFASSSAISSLLLCRSARKKVTVAMSGDGADELFMGYGYYNWLNRLEKIHQTVGDKGTRLIGSLMNLVPDSKFQRASRLFNFNDYSRIWCHIWSQEQDMFSEKDISVLFGEKYEHTTLMSSWNKINNLSIDPYEKISLFDIHNYLPENLLYKMDIASMTYGLEVRVPYLDHNVVEFALKVPAHLKRNGNESKYLMKKLLQRYLPKDLVYRKKWGFPAPVGSWLKGDLNKYLEKYLSKGYLQKQGIFNYNYIEKLLNEFKSGKELHYKRIWSLLIFQMWFHYYINKESLE